jgi:hypothetical protein
MPLPGFGHAWHFKAPAFMGLAEELRTCPFAAPTDASSLVQRISSHGAKPRLELLFAAVERESPAPNAVGKVGRGPHSGVTQPGQNEYPHSAPTRVVPVLRWPENDHQTLFRWVFPTPFERCFPCRLRFDQPSLNQFPSPTGRHPTLPRRVVVSRQVPSGLCSPSLTHPSVRSSLRCLPRND